MRLVDVVQKFGGSSMGSADALRAAGQRIEEARGEGSVAAVVSAARPPGTKGTTDRLLELLEIRAQGQSCAQELDELMHLHGCIADDLGVRVPLDRYRRRLEELLASIAPSRLSPRVTDAVQTMGEKIMSRIFTAHLRDRGISAQSVDAAELIVTDGRYGNAGVCTDRSYRRMREQLASLLSDRVPVVPGFYGRAKDSGYITAFSRGGSDYSGALLARGLNASRYDVCTDVPGVQVAHPRRYPDAPILPQLSYRELLALSLGGATVVHRKAVGPVMNGGSQRQSIPMRIVDTMTGISRTTISSEEQPGVKGVASKQQEEVIVQVFDPGMVDVPGYAQGITEAFRREEVSVDVIATDEATISVTAPETEGLRRAVEELSRKFHHVAVFPQRGVIAVVGSQLGGVRGFFRRLFNVLGDEGIQMISMGTQNSVTFLVESDRTASVEQRIYEELFVPQSSH